MLISSSDEEQVNRVIVHDQGSSGCSAAVGVIDSGSIMGAELFARLIESLRRMISVHLL